MADGVVDKAKVSALMARGYGFECAMCRHMWSAEDRGDDACGQDCGGPFVGKSFPAYAGPLSREYMAKCCFMCGNPKLKHVVATADDGRVGVCEAHAYMLERELHRSDMLRVRGA
jgi:hypothetical protein